MPRTDRIDEMSPHDAPGDAAVAAAFLHRYLQDQEAGSVRELAAYQAEYSGHEDLIAREYAALTADLTTEPREQPRSAAGKTIAHYELLGELGRGGQGVVHKARDLRLKRVVALKVIGPMPRSESCSAMRVPMSEERRKGPRRLTARTLSKSSSLTSTSES